MDHFPRIGIIGIGAMGCLFAARLSPLASVTLLGHWPAQLQAVRHAGLALITPEGETVHRRVPAVESTTAEAPVDLALILVKSHQTTTAAEAARLWLAPAGIAITLQNGLGNREILAAALGPGRVGLGITTEGATIVRPGVVRHAGRGMTHLAAPAGAATTPLVAALAALLRQAGFTTHLVEHVDSLVWGKLAVNAGINPLTALLNVPNGYLAQDPRARRIMMAAAAETAAVAAAQGIPLPYASAPQRALAVAQATAANHSSMLQDVRQGRPTEIEAICGAIARVGQQWSVPTPVNAALWRLVKALENSKINGLSHIA